MLIALALAATQAGTAPYLDPTLPFDKRAADLVGRMTLDEKVGQMVHGARAIPRLKVPAYNWWSEALHGMARNGLATVFPQPIGLGASFEPDLIHEMAIATSDEVRARYNEHIRKGEATDVYQGLTCWAPNINIFRDPRWGRGHETYGEDPFLTASMGVAYVTGMQGTNPRYLKTVATPKHFAVHSGPDPLRHVFNAKPSKRDLWNTYLPAFEACVTKGGAYSVMAAYNRIDGLPASGNPFLLEQTLREKWGFKGYVVSDCGAIDDIFRGHKVVKTAAEAAAMAVNAGCDLECGGAYAALVDAVKKGLIKEDTVDKSLRRLMEARLRLGMFDPPSMVPYNKIPTSVIDSPAHRKLALTLARKSIVLLKNDGILPLRNGLKTIAVVGPNANDKETLWGNYNGIPSYTVTPLEGIRKLAGPGTKVLYAQGSGITGEDNLHIMPGEFKRELYRNQRLQGDAEVSTDKKIDYDWGQGGPKPGLNDHFSIRWTTKFTAPTTGTYTFGMNADDGARLFIDDEKVLDAWSDGAARTTTGTIDLKGGQTYELKAEYYESAVYASCHLLWSPPTTRRFGDALDAADKADAIVACVGISPRQEDEEGDRTSIDLPDVQLDMVKALKATGKPLVIVLVNGGPVSSPWAQGNANAIVEGWYGGQEGGTALAEAIFGKLNPAGRLPVTIYHSTADLPDFADYDMSKRTYRYDSRKPLYPFGYGLSYSKFAYSDWTGPKTMKTGQALMGRVKVTNVSKRDGEEVVQLYVTHAAKGSALRELRWFKRVAIPAGKSVWVDVKVPASDLAVHDEQGNKVVRPETMRASIGGGQPGTPGLPQTIQFKVQVVGPTWNPK